MTTMATEAPIIRNPSDYLTEGQRVRVTRIATGQTTETTITRIWPGEDYGVSFRDPVEVGTGDNRLLHNGHVRSGEWLIEPLADEAPQVGQRVRLLRAVGGDAEVGDLGTITQMDGARVAAVRFDGRRGGLFGGGEHAVTGNTYVEVVVETPTQPDDFVTGTRVRIKASREAIRVANLWHMGLDDMPRLGQPGVIVDGDMTTGSQDPRRIVYIRFDNPDLGQHFATYAGNLEMETPQQPAGEIQVGSRVRIIAGTRRGLEGEVRDATTGILSVHIDGYGSVNVRRTSVELIAPAQPEVVNPIEVGTVVMYSGVRYIVSDKALATDVRNRTRYRDGHHVALAEIEGGSYYTPTRPMWVTRDQVQVIPDTSGMTVEQQLERLQRMIHRVASYEAVRRDWCGEVNTALAPLGLPEHLSTVDRVLGEALQRRPDQLLVLDGEIETRRTPATPRVGGDPGESHYCLEIDVDSYDTDMGFSVSGARVTVCVDLSWSDYDDNPGDPTDWSWSDYVSTQMVREAINSSDILPSVAYRGSVDWSETGEWNEE